MINKEFFLKVGGYAKGFYPTEDFELFERMGNYGPIVAIAEPLLLYCVQSQSASMTIFFYTKDISKIRIGTSYKSYSRQTRTRTKSVY